MARMLGRAVWDRVFCSCCNGPRSVKVERHREKRELARELRPEGLLPTAEQDDGDCIHGCNGGCIYAGSERCNFTCHELTPEVEALFERMDRRAMALMGGYPIHVAPRVNRWIWVSLPYATFAIVTRDGVVVDAAPIARWAVGKPERHVADYYRRKGAEFVPLP